MNIERLENLAKKLRLNEFIASKCLNKTVGMGDSHTIIDMGLIDILQKQNTILYACSLDKSRENKLKTLNTDIFILSANGVSEETGELINIDSSCNRVAGSLYGPTEIIFIIGKNKIAKNLNDAITRARNLAATKNSMIHKYDTPCVKTGKCEDCSAYDRICRATIIYHKKPKTQTATIILINENLGF